MKLFEGYDIIIQAGQSNAEGCGRGEVSNPYVPSDDVMYLSCPFECQFVDIGNNKIFQEIRYPNACYFEQAAEREIDGTVTDFSLSFAREYINSGNLKVNRKILIIRAAVGGTGFSKGFWMHGGVCFTKLREMIAHALTLDGNHKFVALLWHQGEHDVVENPHWDNALRFTEYQKNLETLIQSIRTQVSSNVPVIAAGFCNQWASQEDVKEGCESILKATKSALSVAGKSAFVETKDLKSNKEDLASDADIIHFSRKSLYELGKRYFEAFNKIDN